MALTNSPTVPHPLPPPPRLVRRKKRPIFSTIIGAFFFAGFLLLGLVMMLIQPAKWYLQSHGTPVTATIDSTSRHTNSKGHVSYTAHYHYIFGGAEIADTQGINATVYSQLQAGDTLPGKAMTVAGRRFSLINVKTDRFTDYFPLIFGAVLVIIMTSVLIIVPTRQKNLFRDGLVAPGQITYKNSTSGRQRSYYLTCSFTPKNDSPTTAKIAVDRNAYNNATVGEAVTIIYDANKPKRALAYEYCPFEVAPMVG